MPQTETVKGLPPETVARLRRLSRPAAIQLYHEVGSNPEAMRALSLSDLYYLLVVILRRPDADQNWIYGRCREFEAAPDGFLDLWPRYHYKSTIITFAANIQEIARDPEITIGIFSHTRPIAKAFLAQIKRELETNELLKSLFPDSFYQEPERESPQWSLDGGIICRRSGNPKECTVEASGLVDGQPTSRHYRLRDYDDVVTMESVGTPEQIEKTTKAWELSQALGMDGGRMRHTGTRYHFNDTYSALIKRGAVIPRIKTATDDGTSAGKPVFMSLSALQELRTTMGPYTFGCQMLQNPLSEAVQGFKEEWICTYDRYDRSEMNVYILVDPASSKKKSTGDYTVMLVIGLGCDGNYYLLDGIRDRLNLTQKTEKLFMLHRKWKPMKVGYEEYGLQADIEHIRFVQEQTSYRFPITPLGGAVAKNDRILRLVPLYESGRFWWPSRLMFMAADGKAHDLVQELKQDEFLCFPVVSHDDMLDCKARILDIGAQFPTISKGQLPVQDTAGNRTNSSYKVL